MNKILNGDVLEKLKELPSETIQTIITSPPYWQMRDYGYPEQWGLESTFEEYLNHLWGFMDEAKRVLKKDGTVWINIGDTYSTVSGAMRQGVNGSSRKISVRAKKAQNVIKTKPENIKTKNLLMIPHRFAIGCQERGWFVRNDLIWAKTNPLPESVKDRFTRRHEYIFLFTKSKKYYFNMKAVKTTRQPGTITDMWILPVGSSKTNHFATYPEKLIIMPILAGTKRGDLVLDPFCGTGTTLQLAYKMGRNYIGIDACREYVSIAKKRLKQLKIQPQLMEAL